MRAHQALTDQELAEYFHTARQTIYANWFELLQRSFGSQAGIKMAYLHDNRASGRDLFGLLLDLLKHQTKVSESAFDSLYRKIHSLDYSISDYFTESSCLEQCLDDFLRSLDHLTDRQILDGTFIVHRRLGAITARILSECAEVYEHIAETGKTAFCQTDPQGIILCANREMERLAGEKSLIGKRLEAYFRGDDQNIVRDALSNQDTRHPGIVRMTMESARGGQAVVDAEVGPLVINGQYKGGYAQVTDISLADQQHNRLYDRVLLGIVKLNCKGDILFANKSMLQMLNLEDYQGVNVYDLLPDDQSKEQVRRYLDARLDGKSDEYPLELLRAGDRARVPVMVSAIPDTDLSGERVIGSFAIVRSMVANRMHDHIESHHDERELLQAVLGELSLVVPFDIVSVSKYSYDRKWACAIYHNDSSQERTWRRRWWKLTPAQIQWANQNDILLVEDIEKFLDQPDWVNLKQEPDIQELLACGCKSSIFYPIFQDNRLVAAVSLISKSHNAFKAHHKTQLRNLPIKSAVYMALYYINRRESSFTSDLILNLTTAGTQIDAIAHTLVESIATYFNRQSVSLFKVNRKRGTIRLIDQADTDAKYKIARGYQQGIDQGVLGYVSRHGSVENIGNVRQDQRFKDIYRDGVGTSHMASELCIPICFGGVTWLLNIEDEQIEAFSEEEQKELCRVLEEVRNYLEKTWLSRFLETSLKSSSDAVLVTDNNGRIIQVNPASAAMLPVQLPENRSLEEVMDPESSALVPIIPLAMREIFANPDEADKVVDANFKSVSAIRFKRRSGGTLPVHLTSVDLQADFGHTIYIASDLTAQQRLKEIENLEKVYHEIAIQTKTPLTLVMAWLDRLKTRLSHADLKDAVDKSLRQLKKLGVTYNRLALYAAEEEALPFNRTLIDLAEIVDAVKDELPLGEQAQIAWGSRNGKVLIQGDLFQLRFCFETILSYLLRFVPEDDRITLNVSTEKEDGVAEIIGWTPCPEQTFDETAHSRGQVAQAVADMAFGRRLVQNIITRHGGNFIVIDQPEALATFRLMLPLWKGGRHDT
jgi:PAS domain S-box-containing protein